MIVKAGKKVLASLLALMLVFTGMPAMAFAASNQTNLLDGKLAVTYDAHVSVDTAKSSVTIKAAPTKSTGYIDVFTSTSTTATLVNQSGSQAILSFDYSVVGNKQELTINGEKCLGTNTWTGIVESGASVAIKLSCNSTDGTAKVELGDFALTANTNKTVKFADAQGGTITVNGSGAASVSTTYANGVSVKATPDAGHVFMAWVDENQNILSTEASTTLHPVTDCTVSAVFASGTTPYFKAAGRLYSDLNAAAEWAAETGIGTVVLVNNATLPAGDYTIPAGVLLLIPFDAEENAFLAEAQSAGTDYVTPTTYRKLTMASGAHIDVYGELCVNAKHTSGNSNNKAGGSPTGNVAMIDMADGSTVTIHDNAAAYVWGYIIGSGHMTAKRGSSVYENMQITDFRGGSNTLAMLGKEVLPFSQYYIQNIEAPLTMEGGANEYAFTTLTAEVPVFGVVTSSASFKYIGDTDAMFYIKDGSSVTKSYDGTKDRLMLEANGDFTLSSLVITAMGQTINSAVFNLPISNNITIELESGTATINQNTALQAGAELIIGKDAELKIGAASNVFVYDADQWGKYCHGEQRFHSLLYAPTRTYNRTDADMKDVLVDINGKLTINGAVYTTESGAQMISSSGEGVVEQISASGTKTTTMQAEIISATNTLNYVNVPITPLKLQNGDGSYTATAGSAAGDAFVSDNGTWKKAKDVTVTFDGNGGVDSAGNATVTQTMSKANLLAAKKTALKPNTFENAGYVFKGWTTNADGTGTAYSNKESVRFVEDVTLYAKWVQNEYEMFFDSNGGSEVPSITAALGETITPPADPTREGYEFLGWSKDSQTVVELPTTMPKDGAQYIALWKINTYTITFDTDGGSTVDSITGEYGSKVTPPTVVPYKEGYSFAGWDMDIPVSMPGEDLTIHAKWTPNDYTITFITDGGTEIEPITAPYGGVIKQPDAPTKTGYTFLGWDWEDVPKTMPLGGLTTTALWKINQYTLTFDTAGGSTIPPITTDYGTTITRPANPTREGYTFAGWNVSVPEKMPGEDLTLTAQWNVNTYAINFYDSDGTLFSDKTISAEYGAAITAPEAPVKEGYTFAGWSDGNSIVTIPEKMPAKSQKLTAVWNVEQYTISFDANGGSTVSPITQDYGTSITAPTDPVKEGHKFLGWSPELPGKMPATNMTLTAQWEVIPFTITYVDADGTVLHTITKNFGESIDTADKPADPEKEGHEFTGWLGDVPETMPAENLTITAGWKVLSYTVTFDSDGGSAVDAVTAEYGSVIEFTEENAPTRDQYTFAGWYQGDTYVGYKITVPAENITLTAHWNPIAKVKMTFVDHDGTTYDVEGYWGQAYDMPELPDRTGYTLTGWDPQLPDTIPETDTEYTAQYRINQYTITFDSNGGSEVESITQNYNTPILDEPATPEREGYTFQGWDGELPLRMPAENITLTAQWAVKQFKIAFVDGDNIIKEMTLDYEAAVTMPENPSKEGYVFVGWDSDIPETMPAYDVTIQAIYDKILDAPVVEISHDEDSAANVLAWKTIEGADQYQIYRANQSVGEFELLAEVETAGYTDTAIEAVNSYDYYVVAVYAANADANSAVSNTVSATYHKYTTVAAVEPDCITEGKTEGIQCSVCGTWKKAQETIPALKHDIVIDEAVDATCTTDGLTAGEHCQREGCSYKVVQETVFATGHTEVIDTAVAPTCTETGLTEGKHCGECGAIILAQTEVAALGHTIEEDEAVDATCTTDGLTAGEHCTVCDYEIKQEVIPALGHTEVVDEAEAPTCTDSGLTEGKHCSACGEVLTAQTEVAALGHTEEIIPAVEKTCTTDGWTEGKYCTVCEEELLAPKKLKAEGHQIVEVLEKPATCTEPGHEAGEQCEVCKEVISGMGETEATGHSFVNYESDGNATCTEDGTKTAKCENCTETKTVEDEGSKLEHVFENYVSDNNATCTEDGTKTAKCENCPETDTVTDEGSKLEHVFENYVSDNNATCTEDGTKTAKCENCPATDTVTDEGTKLDHVYKNYVSDGNATCTEDGTKTAKCENCPATDTVIDEGSELGHTEVMDKPVPPTCTTAGKKEGSHCSVCNEVLVKQEVDPATGHTEVEVAEKAPTCDTDGLKKGVYCSVCNEVLRAQEIWPATGHNFSESFTVDKKATLTANGSKSKHCQNDDCDERAEETTIYAASKVKLSVASVTYNGKQRTPSVIINNSNDKPIDSANYVLTTPTGRTNAGTYTYTVKFQGDYSGTKSLKFTINKASMTGIKASGKTATYNGKEHTITLSGVPSGAKVYYKTSSSGTYKTTKPTRISAGTTTVYYKVTKANYKDVTGSAKIVVNKRAISKATLSKTTYVYTGKAIKPSVTVKNSSGSKLTKNTHYTVSYKSNTKVGKATVTITGKGNYKGTIKKTFKINPVATTIKKVTGAKKSFTVKWTKKTKQVDGYQICYGTSTNKSKCKKVLVKKNTTVSKKITGLTKGKTYNVWIRTYKTVKENGKSVKYYSAWTKKAKTVKVK